MKGEYRAKLERPKSEMFRQVEIIKKKFNDLTELVKEKW